MKIQNEGAVLVQIAPLFISQPRNQNHSIHCQFCCPIHAHFRLSRSSSSSRLNLKFCGKKSFWCESVWTLAESEWRAATAGLKPLRLLRGDCGSKAPPLAARLEESILSRKCYIWKDCCHSCSPITAKSAHGVVRTSRRCLGHPARAGFSFWAGYQKVFLFSPFFAQLPWQGRILKINVSCLFDWAIWQNAIWTVSSWSCSWLGPCRVRSCWVLTSFK